MNNFATRLPLSPSWDPQYNLSRPQFSAFDKLGASFNSLRAKSAWTMAAVILTALPYLLFV
jgi:hypothetical protein